MASKIGASSGGGGITKSNISSMDNTLAHPLTPGYYNQQQTASQQQQFQQQSYAQQPQPNPGGILKSNISSSDNPLSFSGYTQPQPSPQPAYNNNNNFQEQSYNKNLNNYNYNNNSSNNFNLNDPSLNNYNYDNSNPNYISDSNQYYDQNNSSNPPPNNYPPLESYRRVSPENKQPDYNQQFGGYYTNSAATIQQQQQQQQQQPPYQQNYQDQYQQNNDQAYRRDSDIRYNVDALNKQAYKQALDQQVAEKEVLKYNREKARIKSELDTIKQYPFGRRTDPTSYIDNYNNNYSYQPSYQPSFGNTNSAPNYKPFEDTQVRLNKDNIVEKPNSLVADVPPYDPIKHRNGFHQGYNYDPWGKPGGGAPLVDANTGRKFTKYTGQVWYDTIGLNPDDRAKLYLDRNRPLTLEEQKQEVELEKQRRKYEEASYKSRTGDLASWITDLESQRLNKIHNHGAHLNHTNVTREKINLEYARKNNVNDATKTYHDELGLQLEERHRQNKLYKLKEDVAGLEHTRKWDDWWGKPGGGAPNPDVRRKDLKGSLESPRDGRQDASLDSFNGTSLPVGSSQPKFSNSQDGQYLYAKSNVRSNHRNLYDNPQPMKL